MVHYVDVVIRLWLLRQRIEPVIWEGDGLIFWRTGARQRAKFSENGFEFEPFLATPLSLFAQRRKAIAPVVPVVGLEPTQLFAAFVNRQFLGKSRVPGHRRYAKSLTLF